MREKIIQELKVVDEVILSIDKDRTVIKTIEKIHYQYSKDHNLFFANGGDQNSESIPSQKNVRSWALL